MLRVSDCVHDRIRPVIPKPTEGQRIGNQIDAAFVFAGTYFVCGHFLRDKMEDSRLKFFRNNLRTLTRCGEAVIGALC
jgi:hypothetical protein